MKYTAKEILQYVEENDVKFVKLTFCDLFGRQKNVSVVAEQLPSIFQNGYLFNSSAVPGFTDCSGDLLLFPDPRTLSALPWRPHTGAVISLLSYLKHPDGSFYDGDTLHLLDVAKQKLAKKGLVCDFATECEFYVFKLNAEGIPTSVPIDRGGYFDCAPEDEGENIRRDIILHLEDMGIVPTASHHEVGPGQNEIDFQPTEPSSAARNFLYFKSAVKNVCRLSGMHATFDPKPLEGNAGSALRLVLSPQSVGDATADKLFEAFASGVIRHARELVPFLDGTPESFALFDEVRSPVSDANPDRKALFCVHRGADGKLRMEINCADCLGNPFLVFALLIEAGLDGMENVAQDAPKVFPAANEKRPQSLKAALDEAEKSAWLKSVLGENTLNAYVRGKRGE